MAAVTVTSACNNSISQSFSFENNTGAHLRDASFSSYLSNDDDTFTLKLGESSRSLTPITTMSPDPIYQISSELKYNQGSEIAIFDAEKYFNGGIHDGEKTEIPETGGRRRLSKEEKFNTPRPKNSTKSSTTSVQSEASWSSQRALLPTIQKDSSMNERKQVSGMRIFCGLGCNNCYGRRSVNINDNIGKNSNSSHSKRVVDLGQFRSTDIFIKEPTDVGRNLTVLAENKQNRQESQRREEMVWRVADKGGVGFNRENCFAFPISKSVAGALTVGGPLEVEEKARMSLEVFGGPVFGKDDPGSSLQRKLAMLTFDSGRRILDAAPVGPGNGQDEPGSDASSDLFEIGSCLHPFFNHETTDDDASSCAGTTTCYEPSEASIDWSVVTASAANFSVASDIDDRLLIEKIKDPEAMMMITTTTPKSRTKNSTTPAKVKPAKEGSQRQRQRQPISLLGCKSDKAVKVATDKYQISPKSDPHRRRRSDSMAQLAMFQTPPQVISPPISYPNRRRQSDSMAPLERLQNEAQVTGFESGHAQLALGTPPLSWSRSAHVPHIYT